ncbi:MAG: GNAT family N-acetyltransferase [Bryobacteraceae bacterium]|jgi:ribosomal protein S18 acetylase RimI-like enzyme
MARLRADEWGTQDYWEARIAAYLNGELHPQKSLLPRVGYVALDGDSVVGFAAGHLTQRLGCDGELEWINVTSEYRGKSVASKLVRLLAAWFVERKALKVCVNVAPENITATRFYMRHGAQRMNRHWLVWNDISAVLENRKYS